MPVVGHRVGVFGKRLEPCRLVVRSAGIEQEAQSTASHINGIGTDSSSRYVGVPVCQIVGIREDGIAIVTADDVAPFGADMYVTRHEAV